MGDEDAAEPAPILAASPARRGIGVGALGALGAMLLWFALSQSLAVPWRAVIVAMGAGALWMARRMWQATAAHLVLTPRALESSDGRVLARMEDVVTVSRGAFAFKPSNGFMLVLRERGAGAWEPGLWWRTGRRVGVGGVTPGAPARLMADRIRERIAGSSRR